MNAAVNNGEDQSSFEVTMRGLVTEYGMLRVLFGALRQARAVRAPYATELSAHLRRDIGLPPDD
jgi:hypothetical protein